MQRTTVSPQPVDGVTYSPDVFIFCERRPHPMPEAAGERENKDHTITKEALVEERTRVIELPRKEAEAVVESIFESIIAALQSDDKIEIRGFGSFRTRQRRGRTGRNPKTGAKVEVPPKKIPFFKPSKELKDFVNHPRASGGEAGSSQDG